jgi:uncharacterized membrane protein YebE (DUF533 family)
MSLGILGALAGVLFGALAGGALFGPIGAAAGLVMGGGAGFTAMRLFHAGAVQTATNKPYAVTCPDCQRKVRVYLDPKEARDAALISGPYRVRKCSRWEDEGDGSPQCDRACEKQIVL